MNKPFKQTPNDRVSEVLKAELEKQLTDEKDGVVLAGHGSHIVTNQFDPAERSAKNQEVEWDDKRFDGFLDRLGSLDKSEES